MFGQPGVASLVVTKRLRATRLSNTVALVDGDAEVPYADHCVIIARGAVDIAHGNGNVVISGHLVNVSHDGSEREMAIRMAQRGGPAPPRPVPPASLLVSSGTVRVAHAAGTVLAAAGQLECSHATDCVLLNSPRIDIPANDGGIELKSDKVRVGEPPADHPITAHLKLKRAARDLAVFWYGDRRYVAERDEPITDEAGAPVQALAGWTVSLIGDDFAVLNNDSERATVVMRPTRR
jgi:hypothetical protein